MKPENLDKLQAIWIIVHVVTLCAMGFVVFDVCRKYDISPLVTTLESEYYPSNLIHFPGVALCTVNRISYRSTVRLAEEIVNANVSRLSLEEVIHLLRNLGSFYDYADIGDEKELAELHALLTKYYDGEYDVNNIMRNLSPQCSEILLKCLFSGYEANCSEIFSLRKTQDGFCCTFNYAREHDDFMPESGCTGTGMLGGLHHAGEAGVNNGLTFVIEPLLDDYYYSILPSRGWKVLVFHPQDYPDNPSGGVTEVLVSPRTETSLKLVATSFHTPDEIISYPIEKRKCLFNKELKKLFTQYTYSDCMVNCRVDDRWKACGCVPFVFPKRDSQGTCDMEDLRCLKDYNLKRMAVFPNGVPDSIEYSEAHDYGNGSKFLHCNECYPDCNDLRYYVSKSDVIQLQQGYYNTRLMSGIRVVDQSIVHVYFGKYGILRLRQDVMYTWYELLSNIGGICGVFVGFSLLSVVEFVFFLLLRLLRVPHETARDDRVTPCEREYSLYWDELQPHRRKRRLTSIR